MFGVVVKEFATPANSMESLTEGVRLKIASTADHEHHPGEVHNSLAPVETALAVTLCLGGLILWPLALLGIPLLVHAIYSWIREDLDMWRFRGGREWQGWGDSKSAMIWLIVTEAIVFASFFAFWFWAKWHTVSWDGSVGGAWPAEGVHHDLSLVTLNTVLLISSGFFAHSGIIRLGRGDVRKAKTFLEMTIVFGLLFLGIQAYEYAHAGFGPGTHPYGTAFFALTGLHGLHVLVGVIAFIVARRMLSTGHYTPERHESLHAIGWYWHFVDAVWILLYLIVYLEVI